MDDNDQRYDRLKEDGLIGSGGRIEPCICTEGSRDHCPRHDPNYDPSKRGNMTTAEEISNTFDNDGMRFRIGELLNIWDVCEEHDATESVNDERSLTRYRFPDGSAIIMAGGGWDLAHPDCNCGWCWAGERPVCND